MCSNRKHSSFILSSGLTPAHVTVTSIQEGLKKCLLNEYINSMCKGPELRERRMYPGPLATFIGALHNLPQCRATPLCTHPSPPFPTGTGICPLARVNKHICILEQQQLYFFMTSSLMASGSWVPYAVSCERTNAAVTASLSLRVNLGLQTHSPFLGSPV